MAEISPIWADRRCESESNLADINEAVSNCSKLSRSVPKQFA